MPNIDILQVVESYLLIVGNETCLPLSLVKFWCMKYGHYLKVLW